MGRQDHKTLTKASRIAEVTSWIVAFLFVLWVVVRHDSVTKSYWGELFANNSLFLTQRRPYLGKPVLDPTEKLLLEPTKLYPTWLAVIRYEANLSVGLLAASASLVLVNAVRQWRVRRVWREPGAVACVVAVVAMSL